MVVSTGTTTENNRVESLSSRFELIDSVTKALQEKSTSCSDVRAIFDEVTQELESLALRLQLDV